jgi:stage III sporulation protein AH
MFVLKRNQIIIAALVVMIAVAGYLNYIDGKATSQEAIAINDTGEIAALVGSASAQESDYEIGEALVSVDDNDDPTIATSATEDETYNQAIEGEDANASVETEEDPGAAVFVNSNTESSYFVQAKLNREQARAKEKNLLTDIINNTNLEQEQKAIAAEGIMEIQKRIEKETAAEAMIEAKGFKEVYVRIDDNSVDVVVNKEALTDAEIAQIEDIVKRKTGMSEDQIHINPMRK